jgi:hypothetical protein
MFFCAYILFTGLVAVREVEVGEVKIRVEESFRMLEERVELVAKGRHS